MFATNLYINAGLDSIEICLVIWNGFPKSQLEMGMNCGPGSNKMYVIFNNFVYMCEQVFSIEDSSTVECDGFVTAKEQRKSDISGMR